MKPRKFSFIKLLAFALLLPCAATPALAAKKTKTPVISATDTKALQAHLGKKVSVEGTVVSTGQSPKDGMRFVNFSDSKTAGFTAALVPAVYPEFPKLEQMVGQQVRVKGELETYKKKTIIKVTRPTQLKTLPKAKAATPKAKASRTPGTKAAQKKKTS